VYLLMVFYSCCQQAYNIEHIKIQINQFNEVAKLPKELAPEWKREISPINKKILWHQIFLVTVSLCIGFLIGICIVNIELLVYLITKLNYLYLFIIILKYFSLHKIIKYVFFKPK